MEMIRNNHIGQQIKILERLQHISDRWTNGKTDGRLAYQYPLLRFAGAGDKKIMMTYRVGNTGRAMLHGRTNKTFK